MLCPCYVLLLDGHGEVVRLGRPRALIEGSFDAAQDPGLGPGQPHISLPKSSSIEISASQEWLAMSEKSADDSSAEAEGDEVSKGQKPGK